jgi:EmrB/QacA subfamily drug resistance transporter
MSAPAASDSSDLKRFWSFIVVCLAALMAVLDGTVIIVALPSIKTDLGFTETSLVWVVNAYLLAFATLQLLSGRLCDLWGQRLVFLAGVVVFTAGSLGCGLAESRLLFLASRATQGIGAAVLSPAAISLIATLFEGSERARVMAILGCVSASGESLALLTGGALTAALNWHWVFFINLPLGALAFALAFKLLPQNGTQANKRSSLNVPGALLLTVALWTALYCILEEDRGRSLGRTAVLAGLALLLMGSFAVSNIRAEAPLIPMALLRKRNLLAANITSALMTASLFVAGVVSTLYMRLVLGYTPMQVTLANIPAAVLAALLSLFLAAPLVDRLGYRPPLIASAISIALGLLLYARAPVPAFMLLDILPGMILFGLGTGVMSGTLWIGALESVSQCQYGIASGILSTSSILGGIVGLSIIGRIAALRTNALRTAGLDSITALNGGYHLAFFLAATLASMAAASSYSLFQTNHVTLKRQSQRTPSS